MCNLWVCTKGGFLSESKICFSNLPISKNLIFEIPAHNIMLLWAGILIFKFRIIFWNIFFWRLGGLKNESHFLKKRHLKNSSLFRNIKLFVRPFYKIDSFSLVIFYIVEHKTTSKALGSLYSSIARG